MKCVGKCNPESHIQGSTEQLRTVPARDIKTNLAILFADNPIGSA